MLSVWERACRRSGDSTESMTSANVKHCLGGGHSDGPGGSGIEMQVTVCPFSVLFETTCTEGFNGDSVALGASDLRGKVTGTLKVVTSWGTLKGDLLVGFGGKGSLEGGSAGRSAGGVLLDNSLTGATLAV